MASPKTKLTKLFPKLRHQDFSITSDPERRYNCIAWAAEKSDRWWWPSIGYFWPPGFPLNDTVQNFESVFATFGYTRCATFDLEPGHDKVAIYVNAAGRVCHMARQLPDGSWTSKLGKLQDIAHRKLENLEGFPCPPAYGVLSIALKRRLATPPEAASQITGTAAGTV